MGGVWRAARWNKFKEVEGNGQKSLSPRNLERIRLQEYKKKKASLCSRYSASSVGMPGIVEGPKTDLGNGPDMYPDQMMVETDELFGTNSN